MKSSEKFDQHKTNGQNEEKKALAVDEDSPSDGFTPGSCGWGRFRPGFLQPLATVWTFLVLYVVYSFTHGVQGSYTISVLTTLERRFNLPSFLSGSLVTVSTVGYLVSVVFVSFFFARKHPPRLFACCMLLTSLCALLYVIPHFVYGTGNDDIDAAVAPELLKDGLATATGPRLCGEVDRKNGSSLVEGNCSEVERELANEEVGFILPALLMFSLSEVLQGVAGAPVWSIGLAYIDDHTDPELSAKLIGLMFTVRFVSPMISFAMGGYFLSIYANLSMTSSLSADHPKWIGAWWLGFLVCSIINFLLSIPASMIPERLSSIRKPKATPASKKKRGGKEKREEERREEVDDYELEKRLRSFSQTSTSLKRNSIAVTIPDWKELPRATLRLVRNPIYTLASVAICIDCFVLGFMTFLPKYIEVQFRKPAWVANLLGGMTPALFGGVSSYVGGLFSAKIKGKDGGVSGNSRMNFVLSLISLLLLFPAMFLSCPDTTFHGHLDKGGLILASDCHLDCGCSSDVFDPVCGSDGVSYFSPCYAGCSDLYNATAGPGEHETTGKIRSINCRCVNDSQSATVGIVFEGFCDDSCVTVIYYAIMLVVIFVSINMYNVPCTTIILRCIDETDKSFALGLQTFGICLTLLPTPIMYGAVFDWTCVLRERTSCSESEGTCLIYDRDSLRLAFHGVTIALRSVSTFLYFLTYLLTKRRLAEKCAEAAEAGGAGDRNCDINGDSVMKTTELSPENCSTGEQSEDKL